MKTVLEKLQELPEPYRSRAIENAEKKGKYYFDELTNDSLQQILLGAFVWLDSPQGYSYWDDLYESLKNI